MFCKTSVVSDNYWLMNTDGKVVAVADVLQITHAAVSTVSQVRTFLGLYNAQLFLSSHCLC